MKRFLIVAALLAVTAIPVQAQAADTRIADLVQTGKVRVGLFPPQYSKNPTTGASKHLVWADIARAFADRIGVQLVLVEKPTPSEAIACLKAAACDLLFLPLDDRAASLGDFSHPIFQFDYTLLVPASSKIQRVSDVDQPGVRIAAVRNHASTNELIRQLKPAKIVFAETPNPTFDLLRTGEADAMASTRNALLELSDQLSGSRVLQDRYGANINRMVVPKGKTAWLAYVTEFVEEAKASGLVQKAIDRSGPRGLTVAPAGDSK